MTDEQKQKIHQILTDQNTSIQEKYNLIIGMFPDYLITMEHKKAIYEKIEGIFHDGLGTYFELLVYDKINEYYKLAQEESNKTIAIQKMENGKNLYNKLFIANEYGINLENEIDNIKSGSDRALGLISEIIGTKKVSMVSCSAQDFRQGNARDVFVDLEDGKQLNFSLKTDKSGKVAIFEGQTPDIFRKVFNRYFLLTEDDYLKLKQTLFGTTDERNIFLDFQNVALLTQKVIIQQLGLINAEVNNLKAAEITNEEVLKHMLNTLKKYKKSSDDSIVLCVNRETGEISMETILDGIKTDRYLNMEDFSLTECKPKEDKYGIEPTIKYQGRAFVSFQVKNKRGKYASDKFQDITIRLRI